MDCEGEEPDQCVKGASGNKKSVDISEFFCAVQEYVGAGVGAGALK